MKEISMHHTKGYQKALIKNTLRLNKTIRDRIEETQCTYYQSGQTDERFRDVGKIYIYI
jgi:hypothetical protein